MRTPLVDLKAQYASIKDEIREAVLGVIEGTRYIGGPEVSAFQKEFAEYCGSRNAVGVASGTAALHLAMIAAGVGIHYPIPLHLQPAYEYLGYRAADFPASEEVAGEILSLPIFPEMTERQVDQVVDSLKKAL